MGSGPTATSSAATTSATRRAMGPFVDRSCQSEPWSPPDGTRPSDGFMPLSPQHDEGMRIDPPPSDPVASGTMPDAMAAAAPPDEPPGLWSRFHGLRVGPKVTLSVSAFQPSSGVLVLPTTTHPAARRRATRGESVTAAGPPAKTAEPCEVTKPAASSRSFTPMGMPASGPGSSPAGHGVVDARRPPRARRRVDGHEGVHLGVERLDALEGVGDELARAAPCPSARRRPGR